jgi:dipeptidyl aminopeptidase/acylaminoacyl peptidase
MLSKQGTDITYFTWPGENHNFNNGSWSEIVQKSADFYAEHFNK